MHAPSLDFMTTDIAGQLPADPQTLTMARARELLDQYRVMVAGRDSLISVCRNAGVPKAEIARRTGIARTTIDRILGQL